jgi:hypothetical protein
MTSPARRLAGAATGRRAGRLAELRAETGDRLGYTSAS